MRFIRFIPAVLLAAGVALSAPMADDTDDTGKTAPSASVIPGIRTLPPVLRKTEQEDSLLVVLPGAATPPAPIRTVDAVLPAPRAASSAGDPERPILRRADLSYPPEFGTDSARYCQKLIGGWTDADAIALLGEPRRHRPSLDDNGAENGEIYAFADPSSRYRELELDFDSETGTLRTVFAYPWKMTWQDCRKLWGARVAAADAEKGRTFYSYMDRRLDVLVDQTGKVISLGLY